MKMRIHLLMLLLTAMFLTDPISAQDKNHILLQDVTIIDGRSKVLIDQDILIENTKIKLIGPTGSLDYPDSATVLNLENKFVIPGLIDSHIHLGARGRFKSPELARKEFRRWIYSGVTTVREMGGDTRLTAYEKRLISRNEIPGPEIYYSVVYGSPDMMKKDLRIRRATEGVGVNNAAWAQSVTSDMNFSMSIAESRGTAAQGIKIYAGIPSDLIKNLTEEAHKQGLKSWCHFTVFPDRPMEVVNAGVDVVSHVWGAFWQDPDVDPSKRVPFTDTSFKDARTAIFPSDMSVVNVDEQEIQLLFQEMVNKGVIWDATYAVEDPKIRSLYTPFLKSAAEAGVRLSTGTDRYNSISEPFPELYNEIEALVNDGILSPQQVIEASSFNGARAIGIEESHGSIEEGKNADIVVLNDDPVEDIMALRSIELTIKSGMLFWRKDY